LGPGCGDGEDFLVGGLTWACARKSTHCSTPRPDPLGGTTRPRPTTAPVSSSRVTTWLRSVAVANMRWSSGRRVRRRCGRSPGRRCAGLGVDLDDLPGAQVRDEQQVPARVEAGVVVAGGVAGQRDRCHRSQRRPGGRWPRGEQCPQPGATRDGQGSQGAAGQAASGSDHCDQYR
jgi:hypothetical protein